MRRTVCFLFGLSAFLSPPLARAETQPHRAEYALRLGPAMNAPRIGTAAFDLSLDCNGWRIKRDVSTEIALTAAWKFSIASKLDGEEALRSRAFRYRTLQVQNGVERETRGHVEHAGAETRAETVSPSGPQQLVMPGSTLMPVAGIDYMIGRLRAGTGNFPAVTFDAEVINDAFLVTLFQILVDAPQMTATEAMLRAQEKGALLAPTMGRQQSEFLGPLIEREIDILSRAGALPPMPDALVKAGGMVEVEYQSPLNRAQRSEEGVAILRTLESLAPLAVQSFRWVRSDEFDQYPFTPADEASMSKLLDEE